MRTRTMRGVALLAALWCLGGCAAWGADQWDGTSQTSGGADIDLTGGLDSTPKTLTSAIVFDADNGNIDLTLNGANADSLTIGANGSLTLTSAGGVTGVTTVTISADTELKILNTALAAGLTVETGSKLVNTGTITNAGNMNFAAGSSYSGGGEITSSGIITANVELVNLRTLVADTTLNTNGTFNFTADAGTKTVSMADTVFNSNSNGNVSIGFGGPGSLIFTGEMALLNSPNIDSITYNNTTNTTIGDGTISSKFSLFTGDTLNIKNNSSFTIANAANLFNGSTINVDAGGKLIFNAGFKYTTDTTGSGAIKNSGTITGDIDTTDLANLVKATSMLNGSTFNFTTAATNNRVLNMNSLPTFQDSGTGSVFLGFSSTGMGGGMTVVGDTNVASLGLGKTAGITYALTGAISLGRSTALLGDTDPLLGSLTVRSGDNVTLAATGSFAVAGQAANNANSGGVLNWMGTTNTMTLGANSIVKLAGVLDLTKTDAAGAFFGTNTMQMSGGVGVTGETVTIEGGMIKLYANGSGISHITMTAVDTVTFNGDTDVRIYGATANVNKFASTDSDGIIKSDALFGGTGNLKSSIYEFESIGGIITASANYFGDAFADDGSGRIRDMLGGSMSANKVAVANYFDYILNDGSANKTVAGNAGYFNNTSSLGVRLVNFLHELPATNAGQINTLLGQMAGEYGAAATVAIQNSSSAIFSNFNDRFRETMNARIFADNGFASKEAYAAAPTSRSTPRTASRRAARPTELDVNLPNRVWGGGFGNWARQDMVDNINGWEYTSGGIVLGYERQFGNFTVGAAGSWTHGRTRINDLSTSIGSDIVDLGLYGGYASSAGWFVNGKIGFGYGWNDYNTGTIVGNKHGKFESGTFSLAADAGYVFKLSKLNIIPSFGVHYTHLWNDGWTESASSGIFANWFSGENYNFVRLPLAVRVNSVIEMGNGVCIIPEFRAAWTYSATNERTEIRTGFAGAGTGITVLGPDSGRNQGLLGVGIKAKLRSNVDLGLDYNFEFRNKYQNHNLLARVGISF